MNKKLVFFLFALLAVVSMIMFSCNKSEESTKEVTGLDMSAYQLDGTRVIQYPFTYKVGKYGGELRDTTLGDPKTFNPDASYDNTSTVFASYMFDGLFQINPNTKEFEGNLVESFEIQTDEQYGDIDQDLGKPAGKMDIVCKLRKDVKWSDGVPFTADDVEYHWNKVSINENILVNGINSFFLTMPNGEEQPITCEKIDDYTVTFHFPRIIANPLLRISDSPLPKHIIEPIISPDDGATYKSFWNAGVDPKELITNGPWMLEQYITNSLIVFKRNPNYWKKDKKGNRLPYLDKLVFSVVKDQNADLLRFKNGESDIYTMRGEDYKTLLADKDTLGIDIWVGGPTLGTTFFVFNQNPEVLPENKLAWFTNKKFRQAFSCLVDREAMVINIMDGIGAPQLSPTPVQSNMYDPAVKNVFTFDPDRAKALLAEIGFKDTNGDGWLEDANGNTVEFEMLTNAGNTVRERILNLVADEAKKVGLNATARPIDFNTLVTKLLDTLDWDCIEIGLTGSRYPETGENVWMPSGNLHMWYPYQENDHAPAYAWEAEMVKNFYPFKFEVDQAKRKVYWSNILKILVDELPLIYTVQGLGLTAIRRGFENFYWDVVIGFDRSYVYWDGK